MLRKIYGSVSLLLLLTFALSACQGGQAPLGQPASSEAGNYTVLTVGELDSLLGGKDFTLINVHTPWQGDIPDTDLHLAFDQIEQRQAELPADKGSKLVVYCLTSGMAKTAVETLLELGYTDVHMLEGGTIAWEEAGLSLVVD